ncbi:hypothetical protein CROQUDRAFT_651506 [Cronartium quercuum f. sp. fusiforme G11]|uniref:Secreted protein n=1 Tax=Cronartium quercuum f. sp. fusiforme G11 TaxID=708437 RepID=A0A9P6NSP6_9BASI|nr:hypothetical protein CROQUDRAFT_651506 [Cronartium quercuum f. sp. fusiforme G11]
MHRATILLGLALMATVIFAQQHSICYDFYLKKDGCVYGSADKPCPDKNACSKKACSSGSVFKHPKNCPTEDGYASAPAPKMTRRYDTTDKSFFVAGGQGACGFYNTTSQLGVCLWSGPSNSNDSTQAGWLNGGLKNNCNKQVYIQRQGQPSTVQYVPIVDSCGFDTTSADFGCRQIYVTRALYDLFNPTQYELQTGALYNLTWDFNNPPDSGKLDNAPV